MVRHHFSNEKTSGGTISGEEKGKTKVWGKETCSP